MTTRTRTLDDTLARLDAALPDHPKLKPAIIDLRSVQPRLREAVARLMDARPSALGAASYDGPKTSGGGGSSTTERLAVPGCGHLEDCGCPDRPAPDTTARDRRKLDKALRELDLQSRLPNTRERSICIHAETVMRIVNAWAPAEASSSQATAAAQSLTVVDHTCEHCTKHRAKGNAERIHRTGTVSGNLNKPMALCHWCYRFVLRTGRLPAKSEVQRNDNGQRVMVKA